MPPGRNNYRLTSLLLHCRIKLPPYVPNLRGKDILIIWDRITQLRQCSQQQGRIEALSSSNDVFH
jgi:hypothetical protein